MTVHLNPYLHFERSSREALEFYRSVLGGELTISTFGEMGATGPVPPPEGVMHGQLETPDGLVLMAADGEPDRPAGAPVGISVGLTGDDPQKLGAWFTALAEGGTVDVPFEKQMWGDLFGQVTDRFGVRWLVNSAVGQA